MARVGVWPIGAQGSLGATVVLGARAVALRLATGAGLVTESPAKEPMGVSEQSFAEQVRLLTDYVARHTHQGHRRRNDRRAVRTPRAR
jgi:hypothetical protein